MFNAQNSAYGRGITSNLVTEEQRVRYNTGGRVQLREGSWYGQGWDKIKNIFNKGTIKGQGFTMKPGYTGGSSLATIPKTPKISERALWEAAKKWGPKAGGAIASGLRRFPLITTGLAGAYVTDPEDWEEEMGISRWDKIKRDLTPWAGTKKKIEQYQEWKKMKKDEAEKKPPIDLFEEKKPTEVMETDTLDWTDQEKKEKMGQIQLKLAQRLVSGARDKWGSKEQMKNIGDWFGDVAAIGDKAELRKDERKYKAMGKAYMKRDQATYDRMNSYVGLIKQNVSHPEALYRTTGIPGAINRPADKDGREAADKQIKDKGVGAVFFDEESNSWRIFTPDGKSVKVTVEEIVEGYKSGKIEGLGKEPEEEVVETKKVIEEDDPVTLAGTKGVIPFDPEDPDFQVMLN